MLDTHLLTFSFAQQICKHISLRREQCYQSFHQPAQQVVSRHPSFDCGEMNRLTLHLLATAVETCWDDLDKHYELILLGLQGLSRLLWLNGFRRSCYALVAHHICQLIPTDFCYRLYQVKAFDSEVGTCQPTDVQVVPFSCTRAALTA